MYRIFKLQQIMRSRLALLSNAIFFHIKKKTPTAYVF